MKPIPQPHSSLETVEVTAPFLLPFPICHSLITPVWLCSLLKLICLQILDYDKLLVINGDIKGCQRLT